MGEAPPQHVDRAAVLAFQGFHQPIQHDGFRAGAVEAGESGPHFGLGFPQPADHVFGVEGAGWVVVLGDADPPAAGFQLPDDVGFQFAFVVDVAHRVGPTFFNATCPGGVEVHADEGGPVFINGKETQLKKFSDKYFEAKGSDTTVSISINPDGSASLTYTGKHGANGVCTIKN